ncbi:MAG: RNA polymerase sigma factor [Deltaproteobacteria bacterium]|nr:RNA polymerase sigma factor [Deltaproteobacteria bacterium]
MIEELAERHRAAVYGRVLRWATDASEAEDLTQETLLRAHKHIGSLEDPQAALAWLLRIADRVSIDRLRRRDPLRFRADEGEPEALQLPDPAPTVLQMAEQEEMSACTQKYLDRLNPGHRQVLWLSDAEGRSAKEIAQLLGISEGAAKIRLHRARENLRALLKGACQFSTDERGVLVCDPKTGPSAAR